MSLFPNPDAFELVLKSEGEGEFDEFVPNIELAGVVDEVLKPNLFEELAKPVPKGDWLVVPEGAPKGEWLVAGGAPNGDEEEAACPNPDDCSCCDVLLPKGDALDTGAA